MKQYEFLFKINSTEAIAAQYDEEKEKLIRLARIKMPSLGKEVGEQIAYHIVSADAEEKLFGVLNLEVERKAISMSHYVPSGTLESRLETKDNELVFQCNKKTYTFSEGQTLEDIKGYRKEYEEQGFKKKMRLLRKNEAKTDIEIYERMQGVWGREQITRVVTSDEDFLKFFPIAMYEWLSEDLEGKKIVKFEKGMPKLEVIIKKTDHQNPDSQYVKFVRENFSPVIFDSAFPYQEQEKEQKKFWAYMESGRRGILVHGPTGNGKSTMIRDYAFRRRIPIFTYTGSENTKIKDFTSVFVPADPKPVKAPSPLMLALIYDGIFYFEEISPVPSDVLTGLSTVLDRQPFQIMTQFGVEYLNVGPNFRFVATGNLGPRYSKNRLTDPIIQRFIPINTKYPGKENTKKILKARAPTIEDDQLDMMLELVEAFREATVQDKVDVGLRGPVEVLNQIEDGALKRGLDLGDLVYDNMIEPLCIYNDDLRKKLLDLTRQKIPMKAE